MQTSKEIFSAMQAGTRIVHAVAYAISHIQTKPKTTPYEQFIIQINERNDEMKEQLKNCLSQ